MENYLQEQTLISRMMVGIELAAIALSAMLLLILYVILITSN